MNDHLLLNNPCCHAEAFFKICCCRQGESYTQARWNAHAIGGADHAADFSRNGEAQVLQLEKICRSLARSPMRPEAGRHNMREG